MEFILKKLASKGLNLMKDLLVKKGADEFQKRTGIDISTRQDLTGEELAVLQAYQKENFDSLTSFLATEMQEVTKRHTNDMMSDDKLSKMIRPMTLVYLMSVYTVEVICKLVMLFMGLVQGAGIDTLIVSTEGLIKIVFGFYFGSRGVEKVVKMFKGIK